MVQSIKSINVNNHINGLKDKDHIVISEHDLTTYKKTMHKHSYHSWTRQTRRRHPSASKRVRDAHTATVVYSVRTLSYTTIKYMQSILLRPR